MAHFGPAGAGVANGGVASKTATILVVDDDARFLGRVRVWLEERGYHVICAETSRGALTCVMSEVIDLALVDYRLRVRENGLAVASRLFGERRIPFILISGFLNTRVTVHAMRLGAVDVLDKPVTAESLLTAIDHALATERETLTPTPILSELEQISSSDEDSPAERLAHLVLRGCDAKHDPKKLSRFAKAALVSSSMFRAQCELCAVTPRQVCDLGRVLRAISLSIQDGSPIISHFSVGDRRTAVGLMRRAELNLDARRVELGSFLQTQHLVKLPSEFVRALGHLASHSPLFFPKEA